MESSYPHIKVVFLCGGIGKRMFPINEDKFLLNFLGKPVLEYQIENARKAGLNSFVLVGNPGNMERIEEITRRITGVSVDFALQKEPRGIAHTLNCAERFLDKETLVVNPNDIFESSAYSQIIREAEKDNALSYLLGYKVKEYFPGGYLEVDKDNMLKHIVEKPEQGREPGNLVNILLHFHRNTKKLLEYIKTARTTRDDVYECALDNMAREGYEMEVIPYTGFWAPIKYPWHIFKAMGHFLDKADPHISPGVQISNRAIIDGKVILGANVRVLENAVVRGPVYIGANSVIGNNVLIRDYSHIGSNCVIGYSTEVKHSYIGDNCWFHSNYIGDSIIDDDCSLGAGAVLANFRLDEGRIFISIGDSKIDTGYDKLGAILGKRCRIGVNTSIMPGVRVGANSFVGPNVCLAHDMESDKLVLLKQDYEVTDNGPKLANAKREELLRKLRR